MSLRKTRSAYSAEQPTRVVTYPREYSSLTSESSGGEEEMATQRLPVFSRSSPSRDARQLLDLSNRIAKKKVSDFEKYTPSSAGFWVHEDAKHIPPFTMRRWKRYEKGALMDEVHMRKLFKQTYSQAVKGDENQSPSHDPNKTPDQAKSRVKCDTQEWIGFKDAVLLPFLFDMTTKEPEEMFGTDCEHDYDNLAFWASPLVECSPKGSLKARLFLKRSKSNPRGEMQLRIWQEYLDPVEVTTYDGSKKLWWGPSLSLTSDEVECILKLSMLVL